ncbi:hypothetical protein V6N12_008614 [Hibiscus sabdariffa]|uniref:Mitochondrial transcription termination factor family protein n=1 Tax=Hibiscus sabdariffa TaxID=183260 RepID=A0ABR2BJE8_9ROSI
MFNFLSKTILHGRRPIKIKALKCHNLQNNPSLSFSTSSDQQSFTVSYLMKTCGLSLESALSASKHVNLETPTQPNSVMAFLKNHGISKSQISTIIGKTPRILSSKPRIFCYDLDSCILPNYNVLRQNGVSELNIVKAFRRVPKTFLVTPVVFKDNVEEVKKMGFNPERFSFIVALDVLGSMRKSTWERKFDVYKKCGWSEKEILEAFRRYPLALALSEDKIKAVMDFLVNVMGFQASSVAKYPSLLGLSMEKRIVPRGLFIEDLMSMGLLEKKLGLKILFWVSEELFLQRFVDARFCLLVQVSKARPGEMVNVLLSMEFPPLKFKDESMKVQETSELIPPETNSHTYTDIDFLS